MNEIRKEIGGVQIDCVDYKQILEVLEQIVVGVKTINQFFDADNYDNNNADFSIETFYTESSLNHYHGLLKQYFVEKHTTRVLNNVLYDFPFSQGS